MADIKPLNFHNLDDRRILNQSVSSVTAEKLIINLAKSCIGGQRRAAILAELFWPDRDDLLLSTLRVEAFLSWPVLEQECGIFTFLFPRDDFNNDLPQLDLFLEIIKKEINRNGQSIGNGYYSYMADKSCVEDYYVECVLRILTNMYGKETDDSPSRSVAGWLGPHSDVGLGDKVLILFYTVMLRHLDECERIYRNSSYFEKLRTKWRRIANCFSQG